MSLDGHTLYLLTESPKIGSLVVDQQLQDVFAVHTFSGKVMIAL